VFVLGAASFISSVGVRRALTHADIRHECELTHSEYTERELTQVGVFWSVCMGMSNFIWKKSNFRVVLTKYKSKPHIKGFIYHT